MTMGSWQRRPVLAALAFLAICAVLILLRPLLPVDETRYLTVAWEMWNGGSYVVPHLNGEVYSHKPPLLFWIINLVWAVTGPSEIAARMVGPLAGAVAILLTARLARALWPGDTDRPGQAAWVLATTGVFAAFGSATMFDTLLTVATLWAMLALWTMARRYSWGAVLSLGAALAFGVLAKGPVILIHVLPVALTLPFWRPDPAGTSTLAFLRGVGLSILLALALVGLWLGPALVFGDAGYRNDILWRQSAGRMVASFDHARPVWFFVALIPLYLWPWGWGREVLGPWRRPALSQVRFLGIWAAAALIGFSFVSGKQIHYLLPELAALALLLSGPVTAGIGRWQRLVPMVPAVLLLAAAVAVVAGLIAPEAVDNHGIGLVELAVAAGVVALGVALVVVAPDRLRARLPVVPATLVAVQVLAYQTLWNGNDPARMASLLAAHAGAGVASTDTLNAGQFSYAARLAEPVQVLREAGALEIWMADHPGGLVIARAPVEAAGLTLVRQEVFHDDPWYAYEVGSVPP